MYSSGRLSSTPSILKKSNRPKSCPGRSVKFQLSNNLKDLLLNYLNKENKDDYVELICKIRDAGIELTDDMFIQIISEARDCISILNENLKLFVQVLLILKWVHRSDEAVQHYKSFILDICSAHNYYTKFALQQLVSIFLEVNENSYHHNCCPSEEEEKGFQYVHEVIKSLLKIIPMSKEVLLNIIKRKFPFRTENTQCHLNYVHNILNITVYEPSLRREILVLIITKLVHLDTITSKEEIEKSENCDEILENTNSDSIFPMEVDGISDIESDMKHETARKLDYCLYRLYKYIYSEIHDKNDMLKWDKYKSLYQDILFIFETVILPTYGSSHTPFVVFYLISFKRKLATDFISYLWNKVTNHNIAPVIRQASVSYMCGILAHASFIGINTVKNIVGNIAAWLRQYIDNVHNIEEESNHSVLRIHGVFYSTCQALFYLICCKHGDFVNCDKNLKFLENLNLGKIVTCHLNPLLVCSRTVVNFFANVTRTYQLAYCFTVLNNCEPLKSVPDLLLEGSFPFDCYMLKRSGEVINAIHRHYKDLFQQSELLNTNILENKESDNEDDFIPSGGSLSYSPRGSVPNSSCFGYVPFNL